MGPQTGGGNRVIRTGAEIAGVVATLLAVYVALWLAARDRHRAEQDKVDEAQGCAAMGLREGRQRAGVRDQPQRSPHPGCAGSCRDPPDINLVWMPNNSIDAAPAGRGDGSGQRQLQPAVRREHSSSTRPCSAG